MNEKITRQVEEMKQQTIGVEVVLIAKLFDTEIVKLNDIES